MNLSFEAFEILLFLLPGLITYKTRKAFAAKEKIEIFEVIITSLIYTIIDYLILWIIAPTIFLKSVYEVSENLSVFGKVLSQLISYGELYILIIAFGVGFLLKIYDFSLPILKKFFKTPKPDHSIQILINKIRELIVDSTKYKYVWNEALTKISGNWVLVELENGKKYLGWVVSFSEDPKDKDIFIADATQILEDGQFRKIEGPGIMLTSDSKIISIEFWKGEEDNKQKTS